MKKLLFFFIAILVTVNIAYSQWTEQTSGVTGTLYSVSAVSDSVAWTSGASGTVLRTVNGGNTWQNATGTGIPGTLALYNIFGIDSVTALVTGSTTTASVYRTSNGGSTWFQVFTQNPGFVDGIWMSTPLSGFMVGDPSGGRWSLWKTSNGGMSWDSTAMYLSGAGSVGSYNNSLYVLGTNIWFGSGDSKVYYSPLNGLTGTWQLQPTSEATTPAIWFNTPNIGMTGATNLLVTTNSGTNWASSPTPLPGTATIFGITGTASTWYVVRNTSIIYKSTNNGTNWSTDYTAPAGNFNHIQLARTGTRIWGVRTNGGISTSNGIIGIHPISTEVPASYNLSQNYPNPFNPTTNFTFALPKTSFVTIKVYDLIGREVAVLSNETRQAGTYKVDFNASDLPSGVYFYTLRTDNFNQTKKMILVK